MFELTAMVGAIAILLTLVVGVPVTIWKILMGKKTIRGTWRKLNSFRPFGRDRSNGRTWRFWP